MYASFAKPNASKCYHILYILNSRRASILVVRIVFIVSEESGQIDLGILIDQERNHSSRDNAQGIRHHALVKGQQAFVRVRLAQHIPQPTVPARSLVLLHPSPDGLVRVRDGAGKQLAAAAHVHVLPVAQLLLAADLAAAALLHVLVDGELDRAVQHAQAAGHEAGPQPLQPACGVDVGQPRAHRLVGGGVVGALLEHARLDNPDGVCAESRAEPRDDAGGEELGAAQMLALSFAPLQRVLQVAVEEEVQPPAETVAEQVRPQPAIQRLDAALIAHHVAQDAERIAQLRARGGVELQAILKQVQRMRRQAGDDARAEACYAFEERGGYGWGARRAIRPVHVGGHGREGAGHGGVEASGRRERMLGGERRWRRRVRRQVRRLCMCYVMVCARCSNCGSMWDGATGTECRVRRIGTSSAHGIPGP
jgi:hypothetical protein